MVKSIFGILLTLFSLSGSFLTTPKYDKNQEFILEEKSTGVFAVTGVKEEYQDSTTLRVYSDTFSSQHIDEIKADAFTSCLSLESLMISYQINVCLNLSTTETFKTIYFTGNEEEFNGNGMNISEDFTIYYESFDEGFIHKWEKEIRPTAESNICDNVSQEKYIEIKELYDALSEADKEVVNSFEDKAGITIESSLKELKRLYSSEPEQKETPEPSQSTMITIILIIAAFGMTFIGAFYLLKDRKIIS